jgi:hypothetical protein
MNDRGRRRVSAGPDIGTLTLTRFNGTAVYRLASAEVRA